MGKLINALAGLMMSDRSPIVDQAPKPVAPRVIVGGAAAPELCMLPSEWPDDSFLDWVAAEHTHKRVTQLKADGINAVGLEGRIIGGREGGPLNCALQCQPGLARIERAMGCPMVFFGEYVADEGFNATIAEHRRGIGEGVMWLYDAVPHGAWVTGREYLVPIEERLARLRSGFDAAEPSLFVGLLDHWMLDGRETFAKARELWAAGFEGAVSKAPRSTFQRGRSTDWLKVKQRHHVRGPIVDAVVKDGVVKRVMVRAEMPNGPRIVTLGSGWSADDAGLIMFADRNNVLVDLQADISFELTVGATRSIRGATWRGLAEKGTAL